MGFWWFVLAPAGPLVMKVDVHYGQFWFSVAGLSWSRDPPYVDQGDRVGDESAGHGQQNPRLYELIKDSPKTGPSPTMWAWPQLIDHLKVASQPVQGPWPPHQEPRPEPDADSLPVAIADPHPPNVER